MENLNEIKARITDINPEYIQLCSDFLIMYSRFEYALKESGFLQNGEKAMASVNAFVSRISNNFNPELNNELKTAVKFMIDKPPRVLIKNNEDLVWEVQLIEKSVELQLAEYIRRVRNSLMHGSKFYGKINPDGRNWRLLSSSMIIIENWIDLNDDVKSNFLNL